VRKTSSAAAKPQRSAMPPSRPGKPALRPAKPPRRTAEPRVTAVESSGPQRIAKLLARAGVASRRDIERMIAEGRIAVAGQVLTTPATLLTDLGDVTVDGKPVAAPTAARLFLFHKPAGCLTTARDPKGRKTIYDVLPAELPRLQPVGRLDMNTEGLLLLTTDGELKRTLELPINAVERRYRVRVYGRIEQATLEGLAEGITVEGVRYGPIIADLERRTGSNAWLVMTLTEGKNREIRRVLEHLGVQVTRLIRVAYGPYSLEGSEPGQIVEVPPADVAKLRRSLA
jgi:23S rRNA pseudouridine2605 synthase